MVSWRDGVTKFPGRAYRTVLTSQDKSKQAFATLFDVPVDSGGEQMVVIGSSYQKAPEIVGKYGISMDRQAD